MDNNQRGQLLLSLAAIIKDYQHLPVTNEKDIPQHIERWLNQFDERDQDVILYETYYVLQRFYFSRNRIKSCLSGLLVRIIGEEEPIAALSHMKFLLMQPKGSSQEAMLELMGKIIWKKYRVPLATTGTGEIRKYIYVDDGIYTGNTLRYNFTDGTSLGGWLATIPYGSEIVIYAVGGHQEGMGYVKDCVRSSIEKRNMKLFCYTYHEIKNSKDIGSGIEVLLPENIPNNDYLNSYVSEICRKSKYEVYPENLFRCVSAINLEEKLFSSPEARRVVEQAFLRKGIQIIRACQNPASSMRPLGFTPLTSLGFGTFFVTYRNIANNCPLVLWWGDPSYSRSHPLGIWYPLFPRVTNKVRDMV